VSEVYKKDSQHSSVNAVLQYQINNDDWRKAIDLEQELKKITNDDIKAFAKKYFKTPTKIIIEGKSGAQDLDLSELFAQKPQVLKQSEEKILDQKELDEIKALSGGISNLRVKLNGLDKSNTPNFEIVAKEDSSLPVAYIETIMPYGTLTLSPKQKYQIGMLGQLISNCGTYNPKTQLRLRNTDIEKLTSYLGMGYSLNPLETRIDLEFNSPSEKLDQSLALLHERLHYPLIKASTNPQFKKELEQELERSKASILNTLEIIKRQGDYKAPKLLNDLIFPEGHIDRNIDPDELIKIIKETKLEDLLEIYNKIYFAGSGKIAASGNINAQTIKEKFVPIISSWNQENHKALTNDYSRMSPVKKHIKASINIVESHNNSPNTQILIANPIDITKQDSDYYAAILANAVLGGSGFSARLTKFVREGKGLVYGIGSNFDSYRDGAGKFSIESSCDPRNSKLVLANILKTIKELMDKGVTDAELELAKENLKKSNSFNSRKAAGEVINHLQYLNRDEKFFNNFNHMIDSISKEQVMAALKRLVKPENFTIVITKPKSTRVKEIEEVAKAKSPADLLALAA